MEFREIAGRTVRRPAVGGPAELTALPADFAGEFDEDSVLVDGGDQAGVTGGGELATAVVTAVNLSGAQLRPLAMADVRFDGVDLSNASLQEVTARQVELFRCRAVGLHLSLARASDLYVTESRLDYATIRFERVNGVAVFHQCTFREAVLSGDLSNVVFADCDLTAAEFEASQAKGCDLRSSTLSGARGLLTLRGARISTGQAVSVALQLAGEAGLTVLDD